MRLRTLPLSLAGVITGIALAMGGPGVRMLPVVLLLLTTVLLQILTNLSNELGDTLHGTDTDSRQGIRYSLQDGIMTVRQMKTLIAVFALLSCLAGLAMIRAAFGTLFAIAPAFFIVLGACAVWAAMRYTLGRKPYGYRGLGDLSVFIFFGLATVAGGYFLSSLQMPSLRVIAAACGIGCFSVAVLNVNNIRDMKTDMATRTTVAILLGEKKARIYQTVLIVLGWVFLGIALLRPGLAPQKYLFLLTLPLYIVHLRGVWTRSDRALDPMLPLLVMSTFLLSLLLLAGAVL